MSDHFVDGAETEFGHDFTEFHGDERHEIDDMFRFAFEVFTKFRILSGDADRAGVFLTDTHHQAAHRDEGSRCESVFFGTEQCSDRDITTGF